MRSSSSGQMAKKRYRIQFGNGRWVTGYDVFEERMGYPAPFSCAYLHIARLTCDRLRDSYFKAGLKCPTLIIYLEEPNRQPWHLEVRHDGQ